MMGKPLPLKCSIQFLQLKCSMNSFEWNFLQSLVIIRVDITSVHKQPQNFKLIENGRFKAEIYFWFLNFSTLAILVLDVFKVITKPRF